MFFTFKEVKARLAEQGISINRTHYNEYRVSVMVQRGKEQEATAYYSDHLEDCLLTGMQMARAYRAANYMAA